MVTLTPTAIIVALRKESVDRNLTAPVVLVYTGVVALRKESVDRNCSCGGRVTPRLRSLSARRAWIEMRITTFEVIGNMCRSPQGERG